MQFDLKTQVIKDDWLEVQLNKPAYKIVLFDETHIHSVPQFSSPGFFYSAVETTAFSKVEYLVRKNFSIVATHVSLVNNVMRFESPAADPAIQIQPADISMENEISELSGNCFSRDRFHQDKFISKAAADQIKSEWIRSYFRSTRGTHLYVAIAEAEIVGFILLIVSNGNAVIDLIGVKPNFQSKGIGKLLITTALKEAAATSCRVGTQIDNYPSLGLYNAIGFKLSGSSISLHYHA